MFFLYIFIVEYVDPDKIHVFYIYKSRQDERRFLSKKSFTEMLDELSKDRVSHLAWKPFRVCCKYIYRLCGPWGNAVGQFSNLIAVRIEIGFRERIFILFQSTFFINYVCMQWLSTFWSFELRPIAKMWGNSWRNRYNKHLFIWISGQS